MEIKGLVAATVMLAAASVAAQQSELAPVRVILVGDSTVAEKNGWGPGFCAGLAPQVACVT